MKIGKIAELSGVPASAIRYYESEGLIPRQQRENGRREFSSDVVALLKVLRVAQEMGFTMKEIKILVSGITPKDSLSSKWKKMAQEKLVELEAHIQRTQRMKALLREALKCNCLTVADCLKTLGAA